MADAEDLKIHVVRLYLENDFHMWRYNNILTIACKRIRQACVTHTPKWGVSFLYLFCHVLYTLTTYKLINKTQFIKGNGFYTHHNW